MTLGMSKCQATGAGPFLVTLALGLGSPSVSISAERAHPLGGFLTTKQLAST